MILKDLHKYYNRLEYIRSTADQIIKDFGFEGIAIHFSGDAYNAYEELFNQIDPSIAQLMETNYTRFLAILYRIDIGEETLKKALKENTSENVSGVITDLIIKRELQKVVIRKLYRQL